ncbi:endosialidase [Pseudomonas phage MiCath]|uniref:Endosialidase n=1 Tax=Pseudomonas phage MiCath TaxID=3003729 RepID=A0AAF0AF07_9CAUD|nr:endosialidase [Pseudomonas phage MiCath]WAX22436.1 endosialidase [Pseudomonas phage MiCath]
MSRLSHLWRPRYRNFARTVRSKFLQMFLAERAEALEDTGVALTVTAAAGQVLSSVAHSLVVGEGPFVLTTAGTAPGGLLVDTFYWVVAVPTADTFSVSTSRTGAPVAITSAGTGVHTFTKASSVDSMLEYQRQGGPIVLQNATDVDDLP